MLQFHATVLENDPATGIHINGSAIYADDLAADIGGWAATNQGAAAGVGDVIVNNRHGRRQYHGCAAIDANAPGSHAVRRKLKRAVFYYRLDGKDIVVMRKCRSASATLHQTAGQAALGVT